MLALSVVFSLVVASAEGRAECDLEIPGAHQRGWQIPGGDGKAEVLQESRLDAGSCVCCVTGSSSALRLSFPFV